MKSLFSRLPEEVREQAGEVIHERIIRSISYFTRRIYNYVIIALIVSIAIVSVYYIDRKIYTIAIKKSWEHHSAEFLWK